MILSRRQAMGAALACVSFPARAAKSSASEWLARWLAAFNDAELTRYAAFVRTHIPSAVPYLDEDVGVREASGGFELLRSEATADNEITAWVRDRNWDRFSRVVLNIDEHGIADVSFTGASPPADFAIPRLSEAAALEAIHTKLASEASAGRFSGAVLVGRKGRVLLREAFGDMGSAGTSAISPATRFCIGSMGKMFTAVGILQLVQGGRLHLSDTLAMHLRDLPDAPMARSVTVEQLLTHTGGTGDFFGPDYERHARELRTPTDFIRLFGHRDGLFPPGSRWGYSNFGFILLGAMLERISGQAWDTYLEEKVFRVASMPSTGPHASRENTAVPLTGAAQTGLKPLAYYEGLPAGGGYSTVDDLNRFAVALEQGALLDARHLALLTTAKVPAGNRQWSLGLAITPRNGMLCYGHGGSAPGVNADFAVYPKPGYTVVVLCNRGHPHAANAAEFIGARLPGS